MALTASLACGAHAPKNVAPPPLLDAPALLSPPEGAVLNFFPRAIDFAWAPIAGAAGYAIEVDCFHCCESGKWCSDVNPKAVSHHEVLTPKYSDVFPGDQPGRWRVWPIDGQGRPGVKTAWREFSFVRPTAPAITPSSFRDPATGRTLSGPGVVGPKAVYSPRATYPQTALQDRLSGEVFMEVVVAADGSVESVRVSRSLRADLDESAVATMKMWRFEPARKDGKAVPAQVNVSMTFALK